ncbi:hypothetical protein KP509_32G048100 [Ceratopteris richardii]|nr:hypothetical protein KP509_32G048100 [Ceratopteris richardii]
MRRKGNPAILSTIYLALIRILNSWGVLDVEVDMTAPEGKISLVQPILRRSIRISSEEDDPVHILGPKDLLVEILRTLKHVYWPWKVMNGSAEGSDFMKAADAANHGISVSANGISENLFASSSTTMMTQFISKLQQGNWTSPNIGDMRRALAASERLLLLGERNELRDYGMLLYHCGLFEPALSYLTAYRDCKDGHVGPTAPHSSEESIALENVVLRLRLILTERTWNICRTDAILGGPVTDPC